MTIYNLHVNIPEVDRFFMFFWGFQIPLFATCPSGNQTWLRRSIGALESTMASAGCSRAVLLGEIWKDLHLFIYCYSFKVINNPWDVQIYKYIYIYIYIYTLYIIHYTWEGGDESQPPKQCSWFFWHPSQEPFGASLWDFRGLRAGN